ncbi:hypothetical protein ASPWEDRAFT_35910 [Aspergillus wentii DTO 134E9]|uniref:Uncharacterized protein n=1 Tax=Aspergillus wentii DTO 134E9 TaxID=1073089 RepID=A0A1L9RTN9_ASPWE|nr:uncharacterized protein ASPWEDRAFT_35910 [Aspergillus wentii DTO 134E9]OJJ38285.1 hypothetical protein ASPWEDRAFT_35910 [Aspergillus wentii DTO 134E9]
MDSVQPKSLIPLSRPEIAAHFKGLIQTNPTVDNVNAINEVLVDAVYREAIPSPIYAIWLLIACRRSPQLLVKALQDRTSNGVRAAGISALFPIFRSAGWKSRGWNVLGGATGVKNILDGLSVQEKKSLCKAITLPHKNVQHRDAITSCVEELLRLLPQYVRNQLLWLYPVCSSEFLHELLPVTKVTRSWWFLHRAAPLHTDLFRRIAVGSASAPVDVRETIMKSSFKPLVRSSTPYTPVYVKDAPSNLPPGLLFYLDLNQALETEQLPEDRSNEEDSSFDFIDDILGLCSNSKIPFDDILVIFKKVLPRYLAGSTYWVDGSFTKEIVSSWSVAKFGSISDNAEPSMKSLSSASHPSRPSARHIDDLESLIAQCIHQSTERKRVDALYSTPYRTMGAVKTRFDLLMASKAVLDIVCPEARLPFLTLLCSHSKLLNFDLNSSPPSEREVKLLPIWHFDILDTLPATDSERLFCRSLAILGGDEFISVIPNLNDLYSWGLDRDAQSLLKIKWAAESPAETDYAFTHKIINETKKESEKGRESSDRLTKAALVVKMARSSSSLDIFSDVVEWSKRYIRDHETFVQLMDDHIFQSETASVLSCSKFPTSRQPKSLSELRGAVEKAHKTVKLLLEILQLSMHEPLDFYAATMHTDTFFVHLVAQRVIGVQTYRKAGLGNEAELSEFLLESLIPIILNYEQAALPGDKDFYWDSERGLITWLDDVGSLESRPYVLRFLDQLAQQRDAMWQEERKREHPEIATQGEGWVKGLDISCLLPSERWAEFVWANPEAAPFVSARFKEVLYGAPDVMLTVVPEDDDPEYRKVDSLETAIELFLLGGNTKDKQDRFMSVWKHYADILQPSSQNFVIFRDWMVALANRAGLYQAARIIRPLRLPAPTYWNDSESTWNPRPNVESEDSEDVPKMVLHYRMDPSDPSPDSLRDSRDDPLATWTLKTDASSQPPLIHTLSLETRETLVISAVLFLQTLADNKAILETPFPSEGPPRYPRISLDDEFVESVNDSDEEDAVKSATKLLKSTANTVPAHILRNLAVSLLDTLAELPKTSDRYGIVQTATFEVIKILPYTDRPDLAVDVALRVIENFPEQSSYHRQLRLLSLGERLAPEVAERFVNQFLSIIQNAYKSGGEEEKSRSKVKITTVKMLAQLIPDADFISPATGLHTLKTLFTTVEHESVRIEGMRGVLQIISRTDDDEVYRYFSAAAVVSGTNEGNETTPTDWDVAEKGGDLPTVSRWTDRPLLKIFLIEASSLLPVHRRTDYTQNVLIPLLQKSTKQHTRWMNLFLARMKVTLDQTDVINFGPSVPDMPNTIFKQWKDHLPQSYLSEHRAWAMGYLKYSTLDRITKSFSEINNGWRETNAGQHWLEFMSSRSNARPLSSLDEAFKQAIKGKATGELTAKALGDEYIQRAAIIARNPFTVITKPNRSCVSVKLIIDGLSSLCSHRTTSPDDQAQQMLEAIVSDIESLRTENWQSSPATTRNPVILPSQLQLQTLVLPTTPKPMTKEQRAKFINGVLPLVKDCAENPILIPEFEHIKNTVQAVHQEDKLPCAVRLGGANIDEHASLYGSLKISLAKVLLEKTSSTDRELDEDVVEMIQTWKESPVEWVNRLGWEIEIYSSKPPTQTSWACSDE